jgi:acyl-CoA thioester hydrolase
VPEPFIHRLRVRYAECDPQGVLFNANYLAYIDHTITELWRAAYGGYQAMLDRGVDIVVAEVNMRFLGSARFDEEVIVEAAVRHLGTTSVTSAFCFRRVDGHQLLDAEIRHVWIDRTTAAKTPMPDWAREGLAPWYVGESESSSGSGRGLGQIPMRWWKKRASVRSTAAAVPAITPASKLRATITLAVVPSPVPGLGGGALSILAQILAKIDWPILLAMIAPKMASGL